MPYESLFLFRKGLTLEVLRQDKWMQNLGFASDRPQIRWPGDHHGRPGVAGKRPGQITGAPGGRQRAAGDGLDSPGAWWGWPGEQACLAKSA